MGGAHCFCGSKDKVFEKEGFEFKSGDSEGEMVSDTQESSKDVRPAELDSLCGVVMARSGSENED